MAASDLIGFAGMPGSGKDTAAEILVKEHNYVRVAFADSLKRELMVINPAFNREDLYDPNLKDKKMGKLKIRSFNEGWVKQQNAGLVYKIIANTAHPYDPPSNGVSFNSHLIQHLSAKHAYLDLLTPRQWMQAYSDAIKSWKNDEMHFMRQTAEFIEPKLKQGMRLVFSDVRYIHEFEFIIQAYGGLVAFIDRPGHVGSDHVSDHDNRGMATHMLFNNKGRVDFLNNVRGWCREVIRD